MAPITPEEDAITITPELAAQLREELGFELEALQATYGDEHVVVEAAGQSSSTVVALAVAPRGCDAHQAFVAVRLVLRVPPAYPAQAPAVQLTDAKGVCVGGVGSRRV